MNVRSLIAIVSVLLGLSAATFAEPPRFEMKRFDTEYHFGLGQNADGGFINNNGNYAGFVRQGFGPGTPFIWNWEVDSVTRIDEGFTTFRLPLINDPGQLAAEFINPSGETAIYLRDPADGFRRLSAMSGVGAATVNDLSVAGAVAGNERQSSFELHAVIWDSNGVSRDLDPLGPSPLFSSALGIADSGAAVGVDLDANGSVSAVYWNSTGEVANLPGDANQARSINSNGAIVGRARRNGKLVGVYWADRLADPVDLPCSPAGDAGTGCETLAINSRGQILGLENPDEADRPLFWIDGELFLLESLVDDFPDGELLRAFDLNDRGQIGGSVVNLLNGAVTPVVLIPRTRTEQVRIDVKPHSFPSCFRIDGRGTVPVAIFGASGFDVYAIDESTLRFEGLEVQKKANGTPQCAVEFVDQDDDIDLVCHFEDVLEAWSGAEPEGTLTGRTLGGGAFAGSGDICLR